MSGISMSPDFKIPRFPNAAASAGASTLADQPVHPTHRSTLSPPPAAMLSGWTILPATSLSPVGCIGIVS